MYAKAALEAHPQVTIQILQGHQFDAKVRHRDDLGQTWGRPGRPGSMVVRLQLLQLLQLLAVNASVCCCYMAILPKPCRCCGDLMLDLLDCVLICFDAFDQGDLVR